MHGEEDPHVYRGCVLVADTDSGFCTALALRLESMRIEVVHAIDCESSIQLISKRIFDVILCSIHLPSRGLGPGKHAGHVAQWLRQEGRNVPFYFLLSFVDLLDLELFRDDWEHANGCVDKSLPMKALDALIDTHIPD